MTSFSDPGVWGFIVLFAVLSLSLLVANLLKKSFRWLRNSLIPTSVIGGILLLIVVIIYENVTGVDNMFNTPMFGGNGAAMLEMLTYHCLALGFIASSLRPGAEKLNAKRRREIFDTGVTTVSTYLIQGILGFGITLLIYKLGKELYPVSGLLLPFGYGQGTGQAMNYGAIYEADGFIGGKNFGLSIAALGFISAGIGGVIFLNVQKHRGKVVLEDDREEITEIITGADIQKPDEVPMNGSIDKMTLQVAIILCTYGLAYGIMYLLGNVLLPGMSATVYGFNFLFGVLMAALVKLVLNHMEKKKIVKKKYINPFLMQRISNFFFDMMIVAGVAVIRIEAVKHYWWLLILLGVLGAVITFFYNLFIAHKLFPRYADEQFLAMYGMLTGTASSGVILLREKDTDFKTPALDNLVFQNFPAIVFGFPMMILATFAMKKPELTFWILVVFFAAMNVILFRHFIFKFKRKHKKKD